MGGWIKVSREYLSSLEWVSGKPFHKGQAWIDLLALAEWQGDEIGQVNQSLTSLAKRWNWPKSTTSEWIKKLILEKRVEQIPNKTRTHIRIVNYQDFQGVKSRPRTKLEQNPNKTRTPIYKDLRNKKEEYNILLLKGEDLDESTEECLATKSLVHYCLSISEWNDALRRAEKKSISPELLAEAAEVVDDWLAGDSAKAIKARKTHTNKFLFGWALDQARERVQRKLNLEAAEARVERAKNGFQPAQPKQRLSERLRAEYEASLNQNQESKDA